MKECPDSEASPVTSFHSPPHSVYTPTQNPPRVPGVSRGDPADEPLDDDSDSDFNSPNTSDAEDTDPTVVFANLAKGIKSRAKSSCCYPSKALQCIKV